MKTSVILLLFMQLTFFITVIAQQPKADIDTLPKRQVKDLADMSLEELMGVKITTGSLISLTASKVPVSLTTITSEDIALTPALTLVDLIEIYVPGALWLNHTSPKVGLRGISSNNSIFLLFVNGVDFNLKAQQGALFEINNWDLNDIESIEIIRGPGSVTYGPGALTGIINITTKNANTSKGLSVGAVNNFTYNSKGGYASLGYPGKKLSLYGYGSIRYTDGYKDADYFAIEPNTGEAGYIDPSQGVGVMPLLGDNFGDPQLKFHLDLNLENEWRLWARYTNAGHPALFRQRMVSSVDGVMPVWLTGHKGVFSALENHHSFNENITLKSKASFSSQAYYDYWILHPDKHYDEDGINSAYGPGNIEYDFSEWHYFLSSMVNINQAGDKYKYAFGINYYYLTFRPPWGEDKMYLLSNDYQAPDGRYIEDIVADGFETNTISFMGEGNFEFHSAFNLLLSARVDKNNYSTYFFSPRIGIISELNKSNVLKLIGQRALRSGPYQQVYRRHLNNSLADPEVMNTFELLYNSIIKSNLLVNFSTSYNWIELLGWVYDPSTFIGYVRPIGELKYFTIEAEAKYKTEKVTCGINHSFIKQINWKMAEGVGAQVISYADYDFNGLKSTGNNLNNMSSNSTKFFTNLKLPYNFILHTDIQVFWKWEGYEDVRKMYSSKYGNTNPTWNAVNEKLLAEDSAGKDIRLNVSASKHFPKIKSTLSIYGTNLLGSKRYSMSTGERYDYPARLMWVNEPAALGIKINVTL